LKEANNRKIIIADDDKVIAANMAGAARGRGYEVALASDGLEAMEFIEKADYQVVITDLLMPRMGGMEFIRQVFSIHNPPAIIVITGHASIDATIECLKHGVKDFLKKPFTMEEFLESVERVINNIEGNNHFEPDWSHFADRYFLTDRQVEVVKELYYTGGDSSEIGERLNISFHTVRSHLGIIFNKVGVTSRLELVKKIRERK